MRAPSLSTIGNLRHTYLGVEAAHVDELTCLQRRQVVLQGVEERGSELVDERFAGRAQETRQMAAGAFERVLDLGLHVR